METLTPSDEGGLWIVNERTLDSLRLVGGILRRWLWLLLLTIVVVGPVTYFGTKKLVRPTYKATATVEVDAGFLGTDPTAVSALGSQSVASTQASLIATHPVAQDAFTRLHLSSPNSPQTLMNMIVATAVPGSQLIEVSAWSQDPDFAARVANAMAQSAIKLERKRQESRYSRALAGLETQLMDARTEITLIQNKINQSRGDSTAQGQVPEWSRQIGIDQSKISSLEQRQVDLQATEDQSATTMTLPSPAQVPSSPVSPNPTRNALAAELIALFIVSGLLVVRDRLGAPLGSPEEISKLVGGAPVLGAVIQSRGKDDVPELTVLSHPRSVPAEAYRMTRTNLLYSNVDSPPRTILVTSAKPGEGKSTTAVNLAACMAEVGARVLIIDADLRRPVIRRVMKIGTRAGLTSALMTQNLEENIISLDKRVPLQALPSGVIPPNPTEILGSQRMRDLLKKVRDTYDVVIIDSPPILAVADATILSTMVDAVLLVVDVNSATRHQLSRARDALDRVGSRISGVVLNKLTEDRRTGYYYAYYYSSGYGSYSYEPNSPDGPAGPEQRHQPVES